jgi:hypothetical protein
MQDSCRAEQANQAPSPLNLTFSYLAPNHSFFSRVELLVDAGYYPMSYIRNEKLVRKGASRNSISLNHMRGSGLLLSSLITYGTLTTISPPFPSAHRDKAPRSHFHHQHSPQATRIYRLRHPPLYHPLVYLGRRRSNALVDRHRRSLCPICDEPLLDLVLLGFSQIEGVLRRC